VPKQPTPRQRKPRAARRDRIRCNIQIEIRDRL
jgi:hypothetical protein